MHTNIWQYISTRQCVSSSPSSRVRAMEHQSGLMDVRCGQLLRRTIIVAMVDRVSTMEVRQRIGDMLNRVALRHDEFIIERKGKPLAALVPVERLEQMRRFARTQAIGFLEQQKS